LSRESKRSYLAKRHRQERLEFLFVDQSAYSIGHITHEILHERAGTVHNAQDPRGAADRVSKPIGGVFN
jgi:hypothetical protein